MKDTTDAWVTSSERTENKLKRIENSINDTFTEDEHG